MDKEILKIELYDEIAKCNRCGFCLSVCPVYAVKGREWASPRGKNNLLRAIIEEKIDWSLELGESLFRCTGCKLCTQACFPSIETNQCVLTGRQLLAYRGLYPKELRRLSESLKQRFNITGEPNENRSIWMNGLKDYHDLTSNRKGVKLIYFIGCVSSLFPSVYKVPQSFVQILMKAGVDFTILGGEEWCCGFPLIQAGMDDGIKKLIEHNIERVRERGSEKVIFSCPSCYRTWKDRYETGLELIHSVQFIEQLFNDERITFTKNLHRRVTYHDPCDLGRKSNIYDPPRNILSKIPGIELVEMDNNRQLSNCCGGGGDLEIIDPELSSAISQSKIEEIQKTGASEVVTSCQQCIRTISGYAKKNRVMIKVRDITELVLEAMQ